MNRHDEIQAMARDIATNVHAEAGPRNELADGLIKLIGLMLNAQGKYLATFGEGELNDTYNWEFEPDHEETPEQQAERLAEFEREQREDAAKYHGIYMAGELMQDSATEIVAECTNPRVNLERWNDSPGNDWTHVDRRPELLRQLADPETLLVPVPGVIRGAGTCTCDPFCNAHGDVPVPQPSHCNCCGGECRNGNPVTGTSFCCYPLGQVCPSHC